MNHVVKAAVDIDVDYVQVDITADQSVKSADTLLSV